MNKKELLKSLIVSFQDSLPDEFVIQRDLELPVNSKKIITVTGVRRCGKTSVMLDCINRLIKSNVKKEQILFLNFDDDRLNFKAGEFDVIIQAYSELFPEMNSKNVYVFFDEVQVADGWEQFVRRLYDTFTKQIFISGSNSKMLATDIATTLRGRTLQYEVFPLSFAEYCRFVKQDTDVYKQKNVPKLKKHFLNWLNNGGFPELVLDEYVNIGQVLQEYHFVMLYKDIAERYQIKNTVALKYFVKRILSNLAKPTSINKITNELRSAGVRVDKNFLYSVAEHLESAYFFFRLTRFDFSPIRETFTDRKYYCVDNGFISNIHLRADDDRGIKLENATFVWLRKNIPFQRDLYFYSNKKECDFLVTDRGKPARLIQACWDVHSPEVLKRETVALIEASDYLKCKDLTIVTPDDENEIKVGKHTIKVVPAWKDFLLHDKFA